MKPSVLIVGGGFGGLSAAALLAHKGFRVTLLEKNNTVGGRARIYQNKGFTFDMGPSWYLMPDVFEHFFSLFKEKPSTYFRLKRLDPSYRIFFNSKEVINISANLQKNFTLFKNLEPNGDVKLKKYLQEAQQKYEISLKHFIYKEYTSIFDFFNPRIAFEGAKLKILESMDTYVNSIFNDDRVKKILQYSLVFLGGSPKNTPAMYSLMSHIDFNLGVWYPMGGIGKVVAGIKKLAEVKGAEIHVSQEVKKLIVKNKKIVGVKTAKKTFTADYVLMNADYHHGETQLLEPQWQTYPESYWEKRTVAPSTFIMYLGIKGRVKKLAHHSLFFAHDWIQHFTEIFQKPRWPDKPSYYVCTPSKTDPTVAPKNCENLFILVPIAPGLKDTPKIRNLYFKKILTHLEENIGERLSDRIISKRIFTIKDYKNDYNSYKGTALGLTHTLSQTALFRPAHKSKKIKNLFYAGQYTHPGIGVPMTLISAEIVANMIDKAT